MWWIQESNSSINSRTIIFTENIYMQAKHLPEHTQSQYTAHIHAKYIVHRWCSSSLHEPRNLYTRTHTHTQFFIVYAVCSLGSGPFNGNDGGKREWWQPDQTMSCHGIFSCLHVFLLLFCFLFDIITINRFLLWLYIHFNFSLIHSFIHLHPSTHT